MKKSVLLIPWLVSIALLAGCGNDQYTVEKQYWHLKQQAKRVLKKGVASTPNELEKVVRLFDVFSGKYRGNSLSIEASFSIARFYIVNREYEKARAQLKKILIANSSSEPVCSEAVFLTGNAYELQGRWSEALGQYKKIMRDYPTTLKGLDVPVYIAQYYKVTGQPDKMAAAFKEAVLHYNSISQQYPGSPMAFITQKLAAQCYIAMKDWQAAVNTYQSIAQQYRGKVDLGDILMDMALIYSKELHDTAKAKDALTLLIKENPKGKFGKAAAGILKKIEKK